MLTICETPVQCTHTVIMNERINEQSPRNGLCGKVIRREATETEELVNNNCCCSHHI